MEKERVCVTGGTGYVASWLVMRLLQLGYSVHATVRSHSHPGKKKDISYLKSLPGATDQLKIFNADLNEPDSFNAAIEGCSGIFHVAHPMDEDGKEPEEPVTKLAVQGLLSILKSCLNSKTVNRVIYTSTAATILYNDKGLSVADESTWSDIDICRRNQNKYISTSYLVSKTVTEKTALDFAEEHGLDLVTIVLPLVVGPFICPKIPSSVNMALAMAFGNHDRYGAITNLYMVHIEDAVQAHIFLLEYPNTKGRYICSSANVSITTIFEYLSAKYPEFGIPNMMWFKENEDHDTCSLSSMKLLDSGFKFKFTVEDMFDGAIQCCKNKGFL
ncbi:protein BRI1-5 ENHANCED 1-like [Tripterygium wilfordii]|uniref:protein BRI1-5 ENHANCED 1-like n=1 Tax=Tripterygium wilfordii TaxID=458696 RepID=UPI0018F851C8|nr:protein BRI1-5 ENHANCED 1-like [Tripterygium wilfordii]